MSASPKPAMLMEMAVTAGDVCCFLFDVLVLLAFACDAGFKMGYSCVYAVVFAVESSDGGFCFLSTPF
jgi:hypothetical protein